MSSKDVCGAYDDAFEIAKKKGYLSSSPAGYGDRKLLLCGEQRCLICMYDGKKREEAGAKTVRKGSVRQSFNIFSLRFRALIVILKLEAGQNVDLRVLQTVTPGGCVHSNYAGSFVILDAT